MKMRTCKEAHEELKRRDPGTMISRNMVYRAICQKKIPVVESGRRKLIDVDQLEQFFANGGCV